MKLFTKPGACSTAVHIVLAWSGQPYEYEIVDAKKMKSPEFLEINPAGAVPAIIDGDFVLTQNAAIMGYIADLYPDAKLAGDGTPRQRAEANRWLSFCNSDVHPAFLPIFSPTRFIADPSQTDALREAALKRLRGFYESADKQLDGKEWLAGFRSYADPYLYITLRWAKAVKVDLSGLSNIEAFIQRIEADNAVKEVLQQEGLK